MDSLTEQRCSHVPISYLPSVCQVFRNSRTFARSELSGLPSQAWQGVYNCLWSQKLKYEDLLHDMSRPHLGISQELVEELRELLNMSVILSEPKTLTLSSTTLENLYSLHVQVYIPQNSMAPQNILIAL